MSLPYLTSELPGIGGVIKQRPEDFFVQEIPAYECSGSGEHVFVEIQKTGLTTFDAVNAIARALGVSSREIGYAGMKDAQAVTRQMLSIWGTTPEAAMGLSIPNIQVLRAERHGNKLRLGHLRANRFAIKVRQVRPTDVVKLGAIVELLTKRGMPNYFGEQRFGRRGDNAAMGAALIRGDDAGLLHHLLGNPISGVDDAQAMGARAAFDRGELEKAMHLFPRRSGMERRILARLIKTGRAGAAVRAVDERLRRLWVSALQSELFNSVLSQRISTIDRLMDGDIACKPTGACFPVESAAIEQPRCEAFEISPTGPLVGYRVQMPSGEPGRMEEEAFAAAGLKPGDFREAGRHKIKGARRALRVRPEDVRLEGGADEHGEFITAAFTLPAGSYATMFMRELMKDE